ncbi:repetin-like [Penaeus indicus]|uniref:repetin-like n=1 Tax=Penaeus indicus TaxID=29960 RepID=UPI00300CE7F7
MSADWNARRRGQSPDRSEESEDDGYEYIDHRADSPVSEDSDRHRDSDRHGNSARYGDSDRHGNSARYGDSDRHGNSARYGDSDRHGKSARYGDSDRHGNSARYGDSDRHGKSARYGDSDRHGNSARYGDSDRHGNSARYGDSDRHGKSDRHRKSDRYGDSDNYRTKASEYEVNNSSESSDDYDQEGQHHRHGQPAVLNQQKSNASRRSVYQDSEEESEDQETQWLVNLLAREPKFQAKKLTVIKQGIHLNDLEIMIQQNTHIFQGTEEHVYLRPQIKTCVWFLSSRGCSSRSNYKCSDLHICPNYISGSCKNNSCSKGHDLSAHHNKLILQPYCLRYIDTDLLRKILQISLADIDDEEDDEPLIICKHYNQGKCFDRKCKYLHFCIYHLESRLKCMGRRCNLNHSFMEQYCTDILEEKVLALMSLQRTF